MTTFDAENIRTGKKVRVAILTKLNGTQVYLVDGREEYAPAEFWREFRQVAR